MFSDSLSLCRKHLKISRWLPAAQSVGQLTVIQSRKLLFEIEYQYTTFFKEIPEISKNCSLSLEQQMLPRENASVQNRTFF